MTEPRNSPGLAIVIVRGLEREDVVGSNFSIGNLLGPWNLLNLAFFF